MNSITRVTLGLLAILAAAAFLPGSGAGESPGPVLSEVAEPFDRPEGAPAYSDVCVSPRWTTRGVKALKAARGFRANWIVWCYMRPNGAKFVKTARDFGIEHFGSSVNSSLPDKPFVERTYEVGRTKSLEGGPLASPHQMAWKSWHGCANSPDYRKIFLDCAFLALDAGADALHMDGPDMNYVLGGCYCEHCMKKFTAWFAANSSEAERRQWGIANIEAFDYRQYCLARPKQEAPKEMHRRFLEFQRESVRKFYLDARRAFDERAGRRVPFSANTRDWSPPLDVFDFALAELREFLASPRALYEEVVEAREHGKQTVRTLQSVRTLLNRQVIATCYAIGSHMICPWDVYTYTGVPRYFGDPKDFADLYGFARDHAAILDGYEDAAVNGMDVADARHPEAPPVFVETDGVFVSVRAKPGDQQAPVVIHLVDWRDQPAPFAVSLDPRRFFPGQSLRVRLERPGQAPESLGGGLMTTIRLPALTPWGVLVVESGKTTDEPVPPIVAAPSVGSFFGKTEARLIVATPGDAIHYTTDGSAPTGASAKYAGPLSVNGTTRLRARSFRDGQPSHHETDVTLSRRAAREADAPDGLERGGIVARYYEGDYDGAPTFGELKERLPLKKTDVLIFPHFGIRDRDHHFAVEMEGWLEIPSTGEYVFTVRTHADCEAFIGDRKVSSNIDDPMSALGTAGAPIALEAGLHPFRVTSVAKGEDNRALRVYYEGPDTPFTRIPKEAFRHIPPSETNP